MLIRITDVLKFCLGAVAVLYPILIFLSIVIFKISPNHLSVFIIIFSLLYLGITISQPARRSMLQSYIGPLLLCLIGVAGCLINSEILLELHPEFLGRSKELFKLYPILVNIAWLVVFGTSLIFPPPFIFQISMLIDKSVNHIAVEKYINVWSYRATIVWCVFFVIDTIIAWLTIYGGFIADLNEQFADAVWAVYNGAVSYIIMGILFVIQFLQAKKIIKKYLPK